MVEQPMLDAHVHFWRYRAADYPWIDASMDVLRRDCLPDDPALYGDGMTGGVIAVQARADEAENAWLLSLARDHRYVRAVTGWLDLESPGAEASIARWCAEPLMRGVRPMLQDMPDPEAVLGNPVFNHNVARVQQCGRVIEILVRGEQLYLPSLLPFCSRHDRSALVLDHIGKPAIDAAARGDGFERWRLRLRELACMDHVAVKLSGLVTEWVDKDQPADTACEAYYPWLDAVLDAFGPRRILFGSDWPVCTLAATRDFVSSMARQWAGKRLDEQTARDFFGGNAMRIYAIGPKPGEGTSWI